MHWERSADGKKADEEEEMECVLSKEIIVLYIVVKRTHVIREKGGRREGAKWRR